jgi:RecB family exonuclease
VAMASSESRHVNPLEINIPSLAGSLVHRLFERFGTALALTNDQAMIGALTQLIKAEEAVGVGDVEHLFSQSRDAYVALCTQPALRGALDEGEALFEVPFSVREAGARSILRGTFDCLVRRRDGGVIVLELKTGKPSPEHELQLGVYLTAARALFPGTSVEGKLVYARQADLDYRPLHTHP